MLAGGRSSRFGRDKLVEPYRGLPLLHHAVLRVADVCDDVIVVVAPDAPAPSLPAGARARVARDASEGEGPLAGLAAALPNVGTELTILAAGDMPELSTGVLEEMLRIADAARADGVALEDGDRFRPLPCVLRTAPAADAARRLLGGGERSVRALLDVLDVRTIPEETWRALDPMGGTLRDVDEPDDLYA